jgi:hypothetical protein
VLLLEEELDRLVLRVVHDEVDGGSATIAGGVPDLTVHLERGTTQVQQCLHQDQWRAHAGIMQKSSDSATCEGGKRDMLAKWKGRFFFRRRLQKLLEMEAQKWWVPLSSVCFFVMREGALLETA